MYKSSSVFIFFLILSICSSLLIDDSGFGNREEEYYESTAHGFWPMPGGNIANNGQTDMGTLQFSGASKSLDNWEGETRSPPVLDRTGYVYTVQKTNTSINRYMCSIECYDPTQKEFDGHVWTHALDDLPCDKALIVLSSDTSLTALVDGHLYLFQLNANHSTPANVLPYIISYTSTLLIPIAPDYYIIDDSNNDLHLIHYYPDTNTNVTNNSTNITSPSDQRAFSDVNLQIKALVTGSPALIPYTASKDGLYGIHYRDENPSLHIYTAYGGTLTAYNIKTQTTAWTVTLPVTQTFMSNVAVATNTSIIYVLVQITTANYTISLYGYNQSGQLQVNQPLEEPAGIVQTPGRVSIDNMNGKVLAMFEDSNDTLVYAYTFANNSHTLISRSLGSANFQGPMSIDYSGTFYVITSQYSGYIALKSEDLSTESTVLNTGAGLLSNVQRNYAAIGNNSLVVTGSGGTVGFAPNTGGDSSSGGRSHTWIILLCVFVGLIALIFIIAVICLIYHYWNKNRKRPYEAI